MFFYWDKQNYRFTLQIQNLYVIHLAQLMITAL